MAALIARRPLRSINRRFRRLLSDRAGGALIVLALSAPVMIGFAGLGTEAASWYYVKRAMQGAADAAATTAAAALAAGSVGTLESDAKIVTAAHNFTHGDTNDTIVTVTPVEADKVEVTISQPRPALLSALFRDADVTISVRAVAKIALISPQACVVALSNTNTAGTFTATGSASLEFPSCALFVNSPSLSAVDIGVTIDTAAAYIVGGGSAADLSNIRTVPAGRVYQGVKPLTDPYLNADFTPPPPDHCDDADPPPPDLSAPGVFVYCDPLKLTGPHPPLPAGTVIIKGGLEMAGSSSLTAPNGTTIILTKAPNDDDPNNCATIQVTGGATLKLIAPTPDQSSGIPGIALYQDRDCDVPLPNKMAGGAEQVIVGAIYFPTQKISFAGGSSTGSAQCTQLIAWEIEFTGKSVFKSNCQGTGTQSIALTGGRLVE